MGSTTSSTLTISGIDVDVVYKDIKNLHIGVYPPAGDVRVAAPNRLDDDQVRLALVQRLPWIKRQRATLTDAPRQSEREMVSGESHYVWGRRLRLKVVTRPGRVIFEVDGDRLVCYCPDGASANERRRALDGWYRQQLRRDLPNHLAKWALDLDVEVSKWSIRRMKTKWGSYSRRSGQVTFNLELAKKHPDCLEYIVVHELAHYREGTHGDRFVRLMDSHLPDWRTRQAHLNSAPLSSECW